MTLLFVSFIAGILTLLAPCILPLLPVIVGGSLVDRRSIERPLLIVGSLGASIFLFTVLLKASTLLLGVPQAAWQFVSATIIIGLGLTYLFPRLWDRLSLTSGASVRSQQMLDKANHQEGLLGSILTGAALGPVFTSCSPTYLFIVAAILPSEFWIGLLYLFAYVTGLCLALGAIALLGMRLSRRLRWSMAPNGWFRRVIGVVLVVTGLMILTGADKSFQAYVIDQGWYAPVETIENSLR